METINRTLKVIVLLLMLVGFAPSASVLTTTKAAITANHATTGDELEAMKKDYLEVLGYFKRDLDVVYGELLEKATEDDARELYQRYYETAHMIEYTFELIERAASREELAEVEYIFNEIKKGLDELSWRIENLFDFTANTADGIKLLFKIISEEDKTVEVTGIGSHEANCTLTIPGIVDGYTVIGIGEEAFYESNIGAVVIPKTMESIGYAAFCGSNNLTGVFISDLTAWYNISFNNATSNPLGYAHHLYLNGEEVKELVIPNSMTSIGSYVFQGCLGLRSVVIGNSVTSIGRAAFEGCSNMTNLTISNSVTNIGHSAFSGCFGLTRVTIPSSVTSIDGYAFWGCSGLTSVTIPNSVTNIEKYLTVFGGCTNLTNITVERGNPKYDSRDNCNAIIETASNTLFAGCKNTVIPNSVTSLGTAAFHGCYGLAEMTIPNSVTSIGEYTFYNSTDLKSVTIPSSVASIGMWTFHGCPNLTSVTVGMKTPIAIDWRTFDNRSNATLYVPAGSKAAYESADIWKEFKEIVEIDASNEEENTLTFHYAKESGLYRDYSTPTLGTPNWNYPEALLMQLNQISSSNKRFAADYDFAYSNAGFDFVDGRYRGYSDSLLIQVSPDLDLTYSEISLLNSDNEDIINAGLVVLTEVKRHDDEGRWVIKIKLQDGKIDALLDKYLNGKYAVAVDNNIVTGYDVSLELVKTEHAYDFNVNGVSVAGIHNRYTNTEQSLFGMPNWTDDPDNYPNSFCYEMTWHGGEAYSTIFYRDGYSESDLDNLVGYMCNRHGHSLSSQRETSGTDNRQNQPILPVAPNCTLPGEDGTWIKIDIEFPYYNEEGKFTPIRGFFVTLDNHFAIEGGNSEKNAWAVYEYRNVAKYSYDNDVKDIYGVDVPITLQPGNKGSIYIKKTKYVIGDVIGFRVHAVNLDGTLTDPDGRAFYVVINDSEQDLNPLDEDDNVDYSDAGSINEDTNLAGTVVNNMYYNIGTDAGGFSAEDGCIVITKETSDEQMEALEGLGITDEELKQNFTGIIFKVPAGKGKVAVTAETTGNMTLKVKVGNGEPMEMELSGKLKIRVPYNVTEETMVYIFAGTLDENAARGMLRTNGEQSLKIYGIELDIEGMVGDANNDGDVNAADIEEVANAIVGNPSEKYNKAAADMDGNGIVDVLDLTQIVEIVKAKH